MENNKPPTKKWYKAKSALVIFILLIAAGALVWVYFILNQPLDFGSRNTGYEFVCIEQFWAAAGAGIGGERVGFALRSCDRCVGRDYSWRADFADAMGRDCRDFWRNCVDQQVEQTPALQ